MFIIVVHETDEESLSQSCQIKCDVETISFRVDAGMNDKKRKLAQKFPAVSKMPRLNDPQKICGLIIFLCPFFPACEVTKAPSRSRE